jgi:D-glycero-D-manno-heptose 1,7-bisphosphate phosphatase
MTDSLDRCVFFDRDGIVNVSPGPGYVARWDDFELLPGFIEVLRLVDRRGYSAVVVTNQRGVARGVVDLDAVVRIHRKLREQLAGEHGLALLDVLMCPHDEGECECRKPRPGMLLEAARRHGLDLEASWMIGDSERDVEAGRRAGCRTVLVGAGAAGTVADFRVDDLEELKSLLEGKL